MECFIFFFFFGGAFLKSIRGESVRMRKPNDVIRMVMAWCDACAEKGEGERGRKRGEVKDRDRPT